MTKVLKLSLISLVAVKGAFAGFSPFLEISAGAYNQYVSPSVSHKISGKELKETIDSKKKTSPVLGLGAGFTYDFEAPFFIGAKFALQNNGQDLKDKSNTTIVSLNRVSASLAGFIGYRIDNFRPYLTFGAETVRAKINDIEFIKLRLITDHKSTTLSAGFVGFGLEYKLNNNFTILAEYIQGSGKTKFTHDILILKDYSGIKLVDSVKSEIEYKIKSFKVGARYYFG